MTEEEITTTMRCKISTKDEYMLFKIKSKAKNIDEVLQKALKLLKKEAKIK